MVKKELHNFKLCVGEAVYDAVVPFSLLSALPNGAKSATGGARAEFIIRVAHTELYSKHHTVILRKAKAPFSVYINGGLLCELTSDRDVLYLDLSGRLSEGDNVLELRFPSEAGDILGAGVYGRAEYVRYDNAIIENVSISQRIDDGGIVTLSVGVSTIGEAENVRAVATLVSASGQIYYGGITKGRGSIILKDPLYWWPKGLGVQNLYKLTVNLYGDREIEDSAELRIGIRRISTPLRQSSSRLEVNGTELVPMGGVFHPISERVPETYEKKLRAAVTNASMAGFNAMVVPAGVVAPDEFYELCDLHGIVVIKEFVGEREEDYLELVRLSRHPSLGFIDFVCKESDAFAAAEKMQKLRPDLEFTMIEHFPKYPSELSLPSQKTMESLLPEGQRNLFSESVLRLTDGGAIKLLREISEDYLCPSSLSEAAYLSGLAASDKIFESLSRARLDPAHGRAIFDSLTDDRFLASGSSVDCFGRRKALHYKVESAFRPLAVFAERSGYTVGFSVSNGRRLAFVGVLEFKIIDNKNRVIYKEFVDCQVGKNASKKIMSKDLKEYISGHENEYYLEYYIKEGLSVASKGTMLFTKPKSFNFLDPKIKADITGRDKRYSITLAQDAYAKGVEISFDGYDVLLSENYFDLTQSSLYKISFTILSGEDSTYALASALRIRSLYDIK